MQLRTHFLITLTLAFVTFTLTNPAWAQTESVIYSFTGMSDGGGPTGGVVVDSKGNLYGTTQSGGANFAGTVFEVSPNENETWTQTVIHSFIFNGIDGSLPFYGLVLDSKGNLYGTTLEGGSMGQGIVFELSPGSNGSWTEQILYNFQGGTDASELLWGNLVFDNAGNLYGMSYGGGAYGAGTIFELSPSTNGTWTEKVIHTFSGGNDGSRPEGVQLALDEAGNLYGVTIGGGTLDYGLAFELSRGSNGAWTEKVLHNFTGDADGGPFASLIFDASGNIYGVSSYAVFKLTPGLNGSWTEKQIYKFSGGIDGTYPESGLIADKNGNFYGMTTFGGQHHGTVFELTPRANGVWTEQVLHRFTPYGGDGVEPNFGKLAIDANGNLYGTTQTGGASKDGVVFQVKP